MDRRLAIGLSILGMGLGIAGWRYAAAHGIRPFRRKRAGFLGLFGR